jgi:ribosome-binding factor A
MSTGRMRRVDEAVRRVLGEVIAGELKDPRVGFVTITDVRTSADLSHARVYVSVLGDDSQREATLEGLRNAHGYVQRRVASELRLKRTPTLTFLYDDTTDRALRIERLLDSEAPAGEAASGEPAAGAGQSATGGAVTGESATGGATRGESATGGATRGESATGKTAAERSAADARGRNQGEARES